MNIEKELLQILESTNKNEIDAETALIQILDLFDNSNNKKECNCCYMTSGEHSKSCPEYKVNI